jgi:uncharacterized protein YheU (UPF0270 family)
MMATLTRPEASLTSGSMVEAISSRAEIKLKEETVYTHRDEEKERDAGTWVLDTGVTNHMSGCQSAFTKLDTVVLDIVRFGDDSVVWIEDHETIMFVCKNGEPRSLEGVYFIPQLATNIVSIRQLNEVGYKIDIDTDVMKIWEPRGLQMVRVKHDVNRLYLLDIKLMQSACFVVRGWGDEVVLLWHERFEHVNMAAHQKLAQEELVCGLPEIGQVEQLCEVC